MPYAWFIQLPLDFPQGVHLGAGKRFNSLAVARDGAGREGHPVLNGTSLAGVMRSIWTDYLLAAHADRFGGNRNNPDLQSAVDRLFGRAIDDKQEPAAGGDASRDWQSCVRVSNYRIRGTESPESPKSDPLPTEQWTYHQRNRHRGTVLDGCLYDIESCPPGSSASVGFWILEPCDSADVDEDEIEELIDVLVGAFQFGVHIGGNSNRGFGRAEVNPANVRRRKFDLTDLEEHAAQIDAHRRWRNGDDIPGLTKYRPGSKVKSIAKPFVMNLVLGIPAGQDVLVGAGHGDDVQMDPQRTVNAAGQPMWRLPGSTLRGLFRGWMHRLAAREAVRTATQQQRDVDDPSFDMADEYRSLEKLSKYTGDWLAWCGKVSEEQRADFVVPDNWSIVSLFGSCFRPGRIKISDGFAGCSDADIDKCTEAQRRVHVAVDRITGGAAEGLLFDNRVLAPIGRGILFPVRIQIAEPRDKEIAWLAQTLVALHVGLLRVGSSKASGRLEIRAIKDVSGTHRAAIAKQFEGTDLNGLLKI